MQTARFPSASAYKEVITELFLDRVTLSVGYFKRRLRTNNDPMHMHFSRLRRYFLASLGPLFALFRTSLRKFMFA